MLLRKFAPDFAKHGSLVRTLSWETKNEFDTLFSEICLMFLKSASSWRSVSDPSLSCAKHLVFCVAFPQIVLRLSD